MPRGQHFIASCYKSRLVVWRAKLYINAWHFMLGVERFYRHEIFFQPSLIGREITEIHETIYHSIMKCDVDIRKDLHGNFVLNRRSTMFLEIADRLNREMKPSTFFTNVLVVVLVVGVSCSTSSSNGLVVTSFWPWPQHWKLLFTSKLCSSFMLISMELSPMVRTHGASQDRVVLKKVKIPSCTTHKNPFLHRYEWTCYYIVLEKK